MRFSPPFDNTAPASVTPGRGDSFANSTPDEKALGLGTQQSNTAPAQTFNIKTQLRDGNFFDIYLPTIKWSSAFRVFFEFAPIFYPPGSNYLTSKGFTVPEGSTGRAQLRYGTFSTAFPGNTTTALYSIILDGQHRFPMLICSVAGYSFYATSAGFWANAQNPNGSLYATGPNGYTAIGHFVFEDMRLNADGTAFTGYNTLWIYVNETNRLMAQPTNAAPEARQ